MSHHIQCSMGPRWLALPVLVVTRSSWFSPATSRLLAEKGSKICSYSYSIVFILVCIQCPVLSMHICTTYYIKLILNKTLSCIFIL